MSDTDKDAARLLPAMLARLGALERIEARLATLETTLTRRLDRLDAAVQQAGRRQGYYLGDHTGLSVMENGQLMLVDTRSRDIAMRVLATGRWEHAEATAFHRMVRPGDTVFDIGANHGVFALLAGQRCKPGGAVHAFEPNPRLAQLITMSSWLNGLQQVIKVHTLAASDAAGEAVLTASEAYSGGGTLRARSSETAFAGAAMTSIACRTARLDDLFPGAGFRVDAVKIDVEGFEGRVLRGMHALLQRSPGVRMVMEFGPGMMAEAGVPAPQVVEMLEGLGLSAWTIGPAGALTPAAWAELAGKEQGMVNLAIAREKPY